MTKVGIRPILDGRRAVRDDHEALTMNTAKRVAKFISSNLKHANGEKVECVLPDTCIGGVTEAAKTAEKFQREGVGLSLSISHTWAFGTETMDMEPFIPKAIWGFNGTERPGAVYLAATLAAHAQKGLPAFSIYGHDVQDRDDETIPLDVQQKILSFVKAGLAVAEMRGKSYLAIGGVSMGIGGSIVHEDFFADYLGMRNEYVDMTEVMRRLEGEIYDIKEYEKAKAWVKANCIEGEDLINPKELQRGRASKDKEWETVIKMTLITRDLMIGNSKLAAKGYNEEALGHNAIVAGFQGQRNWSDFCAVPDFTEAMLNSSFDWNGIREAFVVATENDSLNGISMLFNHLLTDTAQMFSDVRTYWSPDAVKRVTGKELSGKAANGIIHLINSGSTTLDATGQQKDMQGNSIMKPFWDITDKDVKNCLSNTRWCPAELAYFKGGGFSSQFRTTGEMPVTICRINLIKNLGPVLQIAEGYTIDLPDAIHTILDKRTSPSWPTTWFAPILTGQGAFSDVYSVMANWGANHGAISYGHIGDKLITLAAMLRIPVNMHNVAETRIFRPSTWAAFGAASSQGADFRACQNFGPLYK